jgi:post-segregation antitoxin (ccd killing protein)
MPKLSVYLPDELYDEVRRRRLPLSALAREAIERRIGADDRAEWIERMRSQQPLVSADLDTSRFLDEARDELGS